MKIDIGAGMPTLRELKDRLSKLEGKVERPVDGATSNNGAEDDADPAKEATSANDGDTLDLSIALETAKAEAADYKDRFLRAAADLDNSTRRFERERQDLRKFAVDEIMRDLLPVLDGLDKALETVQKADQTGDTAVREGVELIHNQMEQALAKHGLERIQSVGEAFDPNLHQAIRREESTEVDQDTVSEEYAVGYQLNGRLLRAAVVSVHSPAAGTGREKAAQQEAADEER